MNSCSYSFLLRYIAVKSWVHLQLSPEFSKKYLSSKCKQDGLCHSHQPIPLLSLLHSFFLRKYFSKIIFFFLPSSLFLTAFPKCCLYFCVCFLCFVCLFIYLFNYLQVMTLVKIGKIHLTYDIFSFCRFRLCLMKIYIDTVSMCDWLNNLF